MSYTVSGVYMKKRLIYVIISIILILSAAIIQVVRYYSSACDEYVDVSVKSHLSKEINAMLMNEFQNGTKHKEISHISYLSEGRIGSIEIDTINLNALANELTDKIYETVKSKEESFALPIGNTLGLKYLSGRGPSIPLSVFPIGNIAYDITSELNTAGVNQSVHRITLVFEVVVKCIAPFEECVTNLTFKVIACETVIIGEVPQIILSS